MKIDLCVFRKDGKVGDSIKIQGDKLPFIAFKELFQKISKEGMLINSIDISTLSDKQKEYVLTFASRYLYTFDKYISGVKKQHILKIYDKTTYIKDSIIIHKYMEYSKNLINEPANIATPKYICQKVKRDFGRNVTVRVMNKVQMAKVGLNLVNAVGAGSSHEPRFLVMEYMSNEKYDNKSKAKTICLCGKGVTFDAGGTQIKTGKNNSYKMKGDKTGGCIVIGIIKYFAEAYKGHDVNIIGIVPLVENIVSGTAMLPGDIIRAYDGKTVEIIDTDAEGRLILADAFGYSKKYNPDYIFDFATLTGWAETLHCDISAAFFSPNLTLHKMVEEVGEDVGERTWGMPRWLEYMKYCKSDIADVKNHDLNIGSCTTGYMSAMFLAHFVPERYINNWIHFDICNNVDGHIMNANTMKLAINLIKRLINIK